MKRQKWIDMGQSLNLYMAQPSGKKLDTMYKLAWQTGLKTTYYLRSLGATNAEKSTLDKTRGMNSVTVDSGAGTGKPARGEEGMAAGMVKESIVKDAAPAAPAVAAAQAAKANNEVDLDPAKMACSILNGEECEACQ
jgi:ribonucleoside-diphosphate reductase alpha chain